MKKKGNQIGDSGAIAIANALEKNSTITTIYLGGKKNLKIHRKKRNENTKIENKKIKHIRDKKAFDLIEQSINKYD